MSHCNQRSGTHPTPNSSVSGFHFFLLSRCRHGRWGAQDLQQVRQERRREDLERGTEGVDGGAGIENYHRGGATHDGGTRPQRRRLHWFEGVWGVPLRWRRRRKGAPGGVRTVRSGQERADLGEGAALRDAEAGGEVLPQWLPENDRKRGCRRRRQREFRRVQEDDDALVV